jgi:hypothetical protein
VDPVVMRGDTQPNQVRVVINGSRFAGENNWGLWLRWHSGSRIQSVTVHGFTSVGIGMAQGFGSHTLVDCWCNSNKITGVLVAENNVNIIGGQFQRNT